MKPDDKEKALYWKCMYIAELMPIGGKEWTKEQAWCKQQICEFERKYGHESLMPSDYPKRFK